VTANSTQSFPHEFDARLDEQRGIVSKDKQSKLF